MIKLKMHGAVETKRALAQNWLPICNTFNRLPWYRYLGISAMPMGNTFQANPHGLLNATLWE